MVICNYKTNLRPSYLYNGRPYTGKTISLYWDSPQIALMVCTYHSNKDVLPCAILCNDPLIGIWIKWHINYHLNCDAAVISGMYPSAYIIYVSSVSAANWRFRDQRHQHLTHWRRDKMAAIFQTKFSNAFFWMKIYTFRLRCHWILFPSVQLTIFQHWFR